MRQRRPVGCARESSHETWRRAHPSTPAVRFLLAVALVAPLFAQNSILDRRMAQGERLARDFRRHTRPFPGVAENYVRTVTRRLTPPDAHWEIELIRDDLGGPTREPIVFPGYVFVPARLLLMTGSEAELAGMLAHAVAHLESPDAGEDRELAADRRAAEIAGAAGYNPRALIDYLRRVQPPELPRSARLPALAKRVAAIDAVAAEQPSREWADSPPAFADAQEFVRRYAVAVPQRRR